MIESLLVAGVALIGSTAGVVGRYMVIGLRLTRCIRRHPAGRIPARHWH